jgi:hypothetical protein
MREIQGVGDGRRDPDGFVHRKLLLAVEALTQRDPLHVRHHVEEEAVGLARVIEREDVGMLQVGGGLDLVQKALGSHHGRESGFEDLERHLPAVPQVLGQIHRGHAALAELPLDPIVGVEGPVEPFSELVEALSPSRCIRNVVHRR